MEGEESTYKVFRWAVSVWSMLLVELLGLVFKNFVPVCVNTLISIIYTD